MKKNLVLTIIITWFVSCSSENTDEEFIIEDSIIEVTEELGNEGNGNTISFRTDIQPIINSNCITCHTSPPINGAPFPLLNFEQVSNRSSSVFNQVNAGLMPPSGKLPQENIDLIEQWIDGGKPQ